MITLKNNSLASEMLEMFYFFKKLGIPKNAECFLSRLSHKRRNVTWLYINILIFSFYVVL